ncbi:MAG: PIG-L deacetylase family protein [candidate division WOR-3 bacterium]
MGKKILVIAPHPDDETIGAGGTIARYVAEGNEVFLCIVTQGYSPPWPEDTVETQRKQVAEVQKVLGIKQVFFLGFPTVKLNTVPYMELTSALQRVVDEVKPEIVYTSSACDVNQDHRIVFEATLVATRPLPGNIVRRLLCYEVGPTVRFANTPFLPNVYVDISNFLDKKLEAMACYKTELKEFPHPRSLEGLKLIARERGLSMGLKAAECFQLIREIQ